MATAIGKADGFRGNVMRQYIFPFAKKVSDGGRPCKDARPGLMKVLKKEIYFNRGQRDESADGGTNNPQNQRFADSTSK